MKERNKTTKSDHIGIYIHIPFCNKKCNYCDFVSFKSDVLTQKKYVAAIKKEIGQRAAECKNPSQKQNKSVDTIFFGGGTPSCLYNGGLFDIFDSIRNHFDLNTLTEFTVEANPETVTQSFIDECLKMGVNRLSFGLQTTSDRLLKDFRTHSFQDFLNAVNLARNAKIFNINADLILGLKNQSIAEIKNSVSTLVNLKIPHISAYGLKVEDGTTLSKSGFAPDDDLITDAFFEIKSVLKNDYTHYEISNFSHPNHECRHNQKYWQMQDYIGFGISASSFIFKSRKTNISSLQDYLNCKFYYETEDGEVNFLTEYIMLSLRTNQGLSISFLKSKSIDILSNKAVCLLLKDGILINLGDHLMINSDHFYISNSIIIKILESIGL